jgi:hypothetical protein
MAARPALRLVGGTPDAFSGYLIDHCYDEMFDAAGVPRPPYAALYRRLLELSATELRQRQQDADTAFLHQGVTFTVYGDDQGTERIFPYDLLPRIITADEWTDVDAMTASGEHWASLEFSRFACKTAGLVDLARELDWRRNADPLTLLKRLTSDLCSVMVSLPDVPVLSDRFMPMTTWVAPQPPDQRAELEQQQQQQQQSRHIPSCILVGPVEHLNKIV